jgi:hypothetical protein
MSLQTEDFIAEARRLGDFYQGVAAILDDPKGDEDFKFLAAAFATVNGVANYDLETAAIAHMADMWERCADGEEIRRRAFAMRRLVMHIGEAGLGTDEIDALTDSLTKTNTGDDEAVTR